ncbi:hypothetical protein HPULCUR_003516 [Helicostylum pulchrum]|uniref:Chromatin assembly factor 1 subunit A dimerization domain-containing protein n=1 Tax=Helicostylum pulchrum TaxID=562976 RepID=A0ABP9XTU6_9FUNG
METLVDHCNNQFIKDGKVVFHEQRLFTENHRQVSQAIIKFRDWRQEFELEHTSVNATDIPQPFYHLIALLAHESDQSLDILAHHINDMLTPFDSNQEARDSFLNAIRQIIKVTAYEERDGLADVVLLLTGSPTSIPKRLSIYRWQAYDTSKFPSEVRQVTSKRRDDRKLFSRQLTDAFQNLRAEERLNLLLNDTGTLGDPTDPPPQLFKLFEQTPHVNIVERKPRGRLCSSFDTLFYVGLNNSIDLRQRFLNELSDTTKKKRGKNVNVDMRKAWLASTTTAGSGERNNFYESTVYKDIRSLKMKLILFNEDVRPAYYGTWSKQSKTVRGRRPFAKDTSVLDYDYDSEAEWDYDVDGDDIHTLEPDDEPDDEEEEDMLPDTADEEEMIRDDDDEEEIIWVVPEGYLSEDEDTPDKKKPRTRPRIVSRPAKWPISGSKHFPMKSVILGPSFESVEEPDNHPLSDFKIHWVVDVSPSGYSPFDEIIESEDTVNDAAVRDDESKSTPLTICFEPNKIKPPLFQREIDKIVSSNKEEFINIILDNKSKTMMGLVIVLKSTKVFSEYTTAQLQAMIHDVAVQEVRGANKEYNWYLRIASPTVDP